MNCNHICRALGVILMALLAASVGALGQGRESDFNRDWRFAKGDHPESVHRLDYDDSGWEKVRLPHDWAIAGPFDASLPGSTGKLPWKGIGWYRRTFELDAASAGERVYFDFDGVMAFPKVYVNGQLAGEWDYGYISFRVDATPYVKFGEMNVIAVEADTRQHGSRWYPGAGIYRKVRMAITAPVHIAHWGTFVTTPNVTDDRATVRVRSTIENHTSTGSDVSVEVVVRDPNGAQVASARKTGAVPANGSAEVDQQTFVAKPGRWDVGKPVLYTAETTVRAGDEVVDRDTTTFGFRTFEFTPNDGFILNGRRVQLKGVNLHHDLGPLGAAFNVRAAERQLEMMLEMGANAVRTSHNPPAPEVLDLCDRMGLFVWNEAFDKWNATADNLGGPEAIKAHADRQISNLVRRDRNHPSIFVWSVGNEIGNSPDNEGHGKSFDRLESMRDSVLKHDRTRPVTIGCHIPETVDFPIFEPLDLTGWNYTRRYARIREMYPEKPILYSESASTVSTRGYYVFPLATSKTDYPGDQHYVSSYDLSAVPWADIPDMEFDLMEKDPFVGGEFVWTGFDYLGEPTPFRQEARSSYFGIVDLVGIPKDRYYLYRSYWRPDATTVHILPHWNWPDRVGQPVPVFVYTNGDSAELFLNGRSLGRRSKEDAPSEAGYYGVTYKYRLRWNEVVYEPGELKAVAYKNGARIGEAIVRTAGRPASIRLTPDRTQLSATGEDLSFVLVEALDQEGLPSPLADNLVQFEVDGPAEIAGVGNGDQLSLEPFQADHRELFFGKAMLILRSVEGQSGEIRIRADSTGMKPGEAVLTSSR